MEDNRKHGAIILPFMKVSINQLKNLDHFDKANRINYYSKEPNLFVFAGQGDKGFSLNDFTVLNTKTWTWKKLFLL